MAQQQAASRERTDQVDEYDAIAGILNLYMEGAAKGQAEKVKQAFHPDARMFGSVAGNRIDVPVQALIEMTAKGPADTAGRYRGRILSITQVGDAAMAAIAEDGFWGTVSFVDFFTLAKIDGRWVIVNKTFAHTGGEPPSF